MGYVGKAALFEQTLPEDDVDIPGVGTVRVRGLTRDEVMATRSVKDGPNREAAIERKMLAAAMVNPEMTEAEVGQWQKSSVAMQMEAVGQKVRDLSGLGDDAAKEAYMELEDDPEAEFRVPSS